jgi:hypothetical protein
MKNTRDTLGIVHALNDLAQIELGIKIDGCNTILQSGVAGDKRMRRSLNHDEKFQGNRVKCSKCKTLWLLWGIGCKKVHGTHSSRGMSVRLAPMTWPNPPSIPDALGVPASACNITHLNIRNKSDDVVNGDCSSSGQQRDLTRRCIMKDASAQNSKAKAAMKPWCQARF